VPRCRAGFGLLERDLSGWVRLEPAEFVADCGTSAARRGSEAVGGVSYAAGRAAGSVAVPAALRPSVEHPRPRRGRGRVAEPSHFSRRATMNSSTDSICESGSSSSRRWILSRAVTFRAY
jgi:hypothetical protein